MIYACEEIYSLVGGCFSGVAAFGLRCAQCAASLGTTIAKEFLRDGKTSVGDNRQEFQDEWFVLR